MTRRPPSNFAEAVAHLRKAFRGEVTGLDRQEEKITKALALFEKHLESDVVNPMLNEAIATSDPIRKSNLLVAAELGRMLHRETAIIDYGMERAAALALESHGVPAEIPNTKNLLALVDRLMKVSRELTR